MLDEVAATGESIVITKRGRPVARLEPISELPSLVGSVSFVVDEDALIAPLDVDWDAQA